MFLGAFHFKANQRTSSIITKEDVSVKMIAKTSNFKFLVKLFAKS